MIKTTKRKCSAILLGFIWAAILTPIVLAALLVPTSEWLKYWLFYPFFVATLLWLDIFAIPSIFNDIDDDDGVMKVVTFSAFCAIFAGHSGLYLMASGGLLGLDVYEAILLAFVGTFFVVAILIFFVIGLCWLFKRFIGLHRIVFLGEKEEKREK